MKKITLFIILLALIQAPASFAGKDDHGHDEKSHSEKTEDGHDDHSDHDSHDDHDDHDDHGDHGDEHKEDKNSDDDDHDDHGGHGGHDDHGDEEDGLVKLSPESIKEAGIIIESLTKRNLENEIFASGEVKLNSYLSSKVTPRITAQVVARHAKLGDKVEKNNIPLITLSSVQVAEAVGDLLIAHKEWERVQKLGKVAVSAKRYDEAKVTKTQAQAKVRAYGVSLYQLEELYKEGSETPGRFYLFAPQDGTIISDDFIDGELIEPGRVLFNIVNENILWVESQLSPKQAGNVDVGANARIHLAGRGWIQGKVIQKHHMLDERTRTIGIRIEVLNEGDRLHPGMYVDTKIQTQKGKQYLALPTEAVLRTPDGEWGVFVEQENAGEFKSVEIEVVKTIDNYTIIRGLAEGTRIVTYGAFFVQSELAKSGFDIHNH